MPGGIAAKTGQPPRFWIYLTALTALSLVSRLPQLLGPNLLLDGDESLLGLMAKHVAQGREIPVFFYGQHYGLSTVEASAGALAFLVAGTGARSLKFAMLALWTLGVLFLFLAQSKFVGARKSFWITAVLVLSPAWADASMNARGGYITAFTASAALLFLLTRDLRDARIWRWLGAGVLTGLIYLAQPLWLPGLLPILVVVLGTRRQISSAAIVLGAAALTILPVELATTAGQETWGPPTMGNPEVWGSFPDLLDQIRLSLTGAYYLWAPRDAPGPVTHALGLIWCAALPATALVQLYRLVSRRYFPASLLLCLSTWLTLVAEWVLLDARDPRYLLPLSAPLVLLAGLEVADFVDRRWLPRTPAAAITCAMLLLGSLSMFEFRHYNYLWTNPAGALAEGERLRRVIDYLHANRARAVFSMNGLLDSQLIFYSNETIPARAADPLTRYPEYGRSVDHALASGRTVAVVGYTDASGAPGCWQVPVCTGGIEDKARDPQTIFTVDDKYFVYVGADKALLQSLGFRF